MFCNAPVIGVGLDGYRQLSFTGEPYPHNIVLHIAVEGGLIGLLFFLIPLWGLIDRWFSPKELEHTVAASLAFLYFVASLFSGGLYDTRFYWFFAALYMLPKSHQIEHRSVLSDAHLDNH